MRKVFDFDVVYRFCNDNNLCTCATNEQYEKLFMLCKGGIEKISLVEILYILSDIDYQKLFKLIDSLYS